MSTPRLTVRAFTQGPTTPVVVTQSGTPTVTAGIIEGSNLDLTDVMIRGKRVKVTDISLVRKPLLSQLADVDSTELANGAIPIFNGARNVFELKRVIDNPNTTVSGGIF